MSELHTGVEVKPSEILYDVGVPPRRSIFTPFRVILLIIFILTIAVLIDHSYYQNRVYPGVKIENYKVGGKSLEEIRDIFNKDLTAYLNRKNIHFQKNDGTNAEILATSFYNAGIGADWEGVIKEAYNKGRIETVFGLTIGCPFLRYELYKEGQTFYADLSLNEEKMLKIFNDLNEEVKVAPENAYAEIRDDAIHIVREKDGLQLDDDKTRENIFDLWDQFLWGRDNEMPFMIEASTRTWEVELTAAELREININVIIAEFSTNLGASDQNRRHNITLAAQKIHNTFLMPGEEFSFNEIVGNANEAAGYLSAPVIVGGNLVPGFGGGICQVSTTLYNTAMEAGMSIIERYPHSQPVGYVEAGRDATISYPHLDLKFENSLLYPVVIGKKIEDNNITISIYGPDES